MIYRNLAVFHSVTLRQRPKGVVRMLFLCQVIQRGMRVTYLVFCLKDIVNEKSSMLKRRHLVFICNVNI